MGEGGVPGRPHLRLGPPPPKRIDGPRNRDACRRGTATLKKLAPFFFCLICWGWAVLRARCLCLNVTDVTAFWTAPLNESSLISLFPFLPISLPSAIFCSRTLPLPHFLPLSSFSVFVLAIFVSFLFIVMPDVARDLMG